jgi:hypothetical protein
MEKRESRGREESGWRKITPRVGQSSVEGAAGEARKKFRKMKQREDDGIGGK